MLRQWEKACYAKHSMCTEPAIHKWYNLLISPNDLQYDVRYILALCETKHHFKAQTSQFFSQSEVYIQHINVWALDKGQVDFYLVLQKIALIIYLPIASPWQVFDSNSQYTGMPIWLLPELTKKQFLFFSWL